MGNRNQPSYYSKPLARIHEDFNGICALCGMYVELKDASRDHIIPRAAGGGNGRDNIQLTHKTCNNMKGDVLFPVDWKEQLKRQISIPNGYICRHCSQPITKQHKDHHYVDRAVVGGNVIALHTWCNEERLKYGKLY